MLGVLYLAVSFFTGYVVCSYVFPELAEAAGRTYRRRDIKLSRYFTLLPAWFASGMLIVTWSVYFVAYFMRSSAGSLMYANIIVLSAAAAFSAAGTFFLARRGAGRPLKGEFKKLTHAEKFFVVCLLLFSVLLMWRTLFSAHGQLYIGLSVFSDFGPHIGMSSSFAYGNNFPTSFTHFAGAGTKLPFMFDFLAGNLILLGLPTDFAFNFPSAMSLMGSVMLLYALTVRISSRKLAGFLSCLFFLFRSSGSLLTYLAEIPAGGGIFEKLFANTDFIGYTTYEDRGLWNLNVYLNQRQLMFGIMVFLLVITLFLPNIYGFSLRFRASLKQLTERKEEEKAFFLKKAYIRTKHFLKISIGNSEGWRIHAAIPAIAAGIMFGSVHYWSNAVLIAGLAVLIFMMLISDRRLELMLVIIIAGGLSLLQNLFFGGEIFGIIEPSYGFLAETKTIFGTADYLLALLGVFPVLLLIAFMTAAGMRKALMAVFSIPFILAFFVSFSMDVSGNHTLIILSVMLQNIFIAALLTKLYDNKSLWTRLVCVLSVVCMTATGVYDLTTIWRKNLPSMSITLNEEDSLTAWIRENCRAGDIFLSEEYCVNQAVLGGAQMFLGWPYYAWTVGCPIYERRELAAQIYSAGGLPFLRQLVEDNGIRYIMVAHENRVSENYVLNEENIAAAYECVFEEGNGQWRTCIYDTAAVLK